ncbi:MAG: hypothetical protein JNK56_35100 [Myxococcales bacterium]|nr:hypothetical protein [Myxococcales bacterium]
MAGHHVDHTHRTHKGRKWTYLIVGIVLVLGAVIANFAMNNPELAHKGIDTIAGLPSWAFPAGAGTLGAVLFWIGLKIETDWPEYLGALLVSGSVLAGEVLLGWHSFELGGIVAIPYAIPALVLLVLLMIGNAKSR